MRLSTIPHILYIDDYSESSQLIDILLYIKKCKYNFSVANTPSKALELIASQPFNLYIIENKLPEMTGIELCRKIREKDKYTPILFFTNRAQTLDREMSLASGATEFIFKPAALEKITDTIKQLLGENKQSFATKAQFITSQNISRFS